MHCSVWYGLSWCFSSIVYQFCGLCVESGQLDPPGLLILPQGSGLDHLQLAVWRWQGFLRATLPRTTSLRVLSCHPCLCSCPSPLGHQPWVYFRRAKVCCWKSGLYMNHLRVFWALYPTLWRTYKERIWDMRQRESVRTLPIQKVAKVFLPISKVSEIE